MSEQLGRIVVPVLHPGLRTTHNVNIYDVFIPISGLRRGAPHISLFARRIFVDILQLAIMGSLGNSSNGLFKDTTGVPFAVLSEPNKQDVDRRINENHPSSPSQPRQRDLDEDEQDDAQRTSFADLTVNLILCGLGAGILSLPWTLAGAGVANGLFWNFFILAVCYGTNMLLVLASERTQVFCFEDLLDLAVGG